MNKKTWENLQFKSEERWSWAEKIQSRIRQGYSSMANERDLNGQSVIYTIVIEKYRPVKVWHFWSQFEWYRATEIIQCIIIFLSLSDYKVRIMLVNYFSTTSKNKGISHLLFFFLLLSGNHCTNKLVHQNFKLSLTYYTTSQLHNPIIPECLVCFFWYKRPFR